MKRPRDWVKHICQFCDKELEEFKLLVPECLCEEFQKAKDQYKQELKDSQPPVVSEEEYDSKYPAVYLGERLILNSTEEGAHKLKLEARKYEDGTGLCVWQTFPGISDDAGLAWDFSHIEAQALQDLLAEYLKGVD